MLTASLYLAAFTIAAVSFAHICMSVSISNTARRWSRCGLYCPPRNNVFPTSLLRLCGPQGVIQHELVNRRVDRYSLNSHGRLKPFTTDWPNWGRHILPRSSVKRGVLLNAFSSTAVPTVILESEQTGFFTQQLSVDQARPESFAYLRFCLTIVGDNLDLLRLRRR